MLVRFTAVALLGWTVVEFALYWLISQHDHTPIQILPCVLKSIPALLGIFMLVGPRPSRNGFRRQILREENPFSSD